MDGDGSRLVRWGERALRWCAVANIGFGVLAVGCLIASFVAEPLLAAQLGRKYRDAVFIPAVIWELRTLILIGVIAVWPLDRCLRALADVLRSVRRGAPFDPDNAARVTTIGWGLVGVQCVDLFGSALTALIARTGADVAAWTPSLAGWISVLIAFVLARVFAAGARLDAELEGTV
ncbi:DUF2975 domain-containing protein [Sphingomonas sp. LR60]|uniref:DUF2975 domain-containing protein n=1 Tax=Sphingomonas sp. LR60 TaxID=3050233 RepID=UPI002FE0F207